MPIFKKKIKFLSKYNIYNISSQITYQRKPQRLHKNNPMRSCFMNNRQFQQMLIFAHTQKTFHVSYSHIEQYNRKKAHIPHVRLSD